MKKMSSMSWVAGCRSNQIRALIIAASLLAAGLTTAHAFLRDAGVHAPPVGGTFDYNSFGPGAAGFPAIGGTYVDPVFGEKIRRLTNIYPAVNSEDIYGHHWSNANGTMTFSRVADATRILNTATGAVIDGDAPCGNPCFEMNWHPTNPDLYYYLNGLNLMERSVSTRIATSIHTFPATLQGMGGSLNWIDATGDLFVVTYSGTAHLWKRSINLVYSGTVVPANSGGWTTITPDGNYLVTAAGPGNSHLSYAVNHANRSISGTGVNFWTLCGDHGAVVSASNGKNYFVTFNCYSQSGLYRVDITLNQQGRSEAQQIADNMRLVPLNFTSTGDGHMSGGCIGANKDWVITDLEAVGVDQFGGQLPSPWDVYRGEIIAMNVTTLEVRRLAHHRSRIPPSTGLAYYAQPRISTSWDCSMLTWTSNYNRNPTVGYADLYGMSFIGAGSGGNATTPPPSPTNLSVN
jgi:hypothetical protein